MSSWISAAASKKEKPLVSHEDGGLRHDWRNGIMPPHKTKASSRRRRNSESDGEGLKDEDVCEERPRKEKGRGKQVCSLLFCLIIEIHLPGPSLDVRDRASESSSITTTGPIEPAHRRLSWGLLQLVDHSQSK